MTRHGSKHRRWTRQQPSHSGENNCSQQQQAAASEEGEGSSTQQAAAAAASSSSTRKQQHSQQQQQQQAAKQRSEEGRQQQRSGPDAKGAYRTPVGRQGRWAARVDLPLVDRLAVNRPLFDRSWAARGWWALSNCGSLTGPLSICRKSTGPVDGPLFDTSGYRFPPPIRQAHISANFCKGPLILRFSI